MHSSVRPSKPKIDFEIDQSSGERFPVPYLGEVTLDVVPQLLESKASVPIIRLQQHWDPLEQGSFQRTTVRLAWGRGRLFVYAEIEDCDIFNSARELNEQTWLLGDTFEMFFKNDDDKHYVEFHVTPKNVRFQLRIPGAGALADAVLIKDPAAIESMAWQSNKRDGWFVCAGIPAEAVCSQKGPLLGKSWSFSFCRYDYSRGNPCPILSSSSRLTSPAFHNLQEWDRLVFVD